jgi:hypothetical protein
MTALMYASQNGHTAAAEAIVAADPHQDHIRMTEVRYAGRGGGVLGGMGIGGEGGYVLRRGGGRGWGRGGNVYSLPSILYYPPYVLL